MIENAAADYALDAGFSLTRFVGVLPLDPPVPASYQINTSTVAESAANSAIVMRWGRWAGGDITITDATGTLTLVYDHHVRELTERLTEMQHDLGHHVVSSLHVHLDHDHCLEVVVMRGPARLLEKAGSRIAATKGVIHGKLTLTGVPVPLASQASFGSRE